MFYDRVPLTKQYGVHIVPCSPLFPCVYVNYFYFPLTNDTESRFQAPFAQPHTCSPHFITASSWSIFLAIYYQPLFAFLSPFICLLCAYLFDNNKDASDLYTLNWLHFNICLLYTSFVY